MKKLEQTIIVGNIEFLDKKVIIHSVDEVYKSGSTEELVVLIDTFDNESKDWLILEPYSGVIEVTKDCLLKLVGCIRG